MAAVTMLAYRVSEIAFRNNLPAKASLSLATGVSYRVKHTPTGVIRGEMKVTVSDKEKTSDFEIVVSAVGVFRTDEKDQQLVHKDSFRMLYPHLRALVTTVTANAGIPPILLPPVDPDGASTLKVDFHPGGVPAEE